MDDDENTSHMPLEQGFAFLFGVCYGSGSLVAIFIFWVKPVFAARLPRVFNEDGCLIFLRPVLFIILPGMLWPLALLGLAVWKCLNTPMHRGWKGVTEATSCCGVKRRGERDRDIEMGAPQRCIPHC